MNYKINGEICEGGIPAQNFSISTALNFLCKAAVLENRGKSWRVKLRFILKIFLKNFLRIGEIVKIVIVFAKWIGLKVWINTFSVCVDIRQLVIVGKNNYLHIVKFNFTCIQTDWASPRPACEFWRKNRKNSIAFAFNPIQLYSAIARNIFLFGRSLNWVI